MPLGHDCYAVPGSRASTRYTVQIAFDRTGQLATAACTCPDFLDPTPTWGAPLLHGVRVCKHILAACRQAKEAPSMASFPSPMRHKRIHRPGMSFLALVAIRE